VTATNADGTASSTSAATATVAAPAPVAAPVFPPSAVVPPSIVGAAVVGETLAADDGVWSDAVSLARQWQRCSATGEACVAIDGASGSTYVVGPEDVGSTLVILVSATGAVGTGLAASTASDVVAASPAAAPAAPTAVPPTALAPPAVAGDPIAGALLSASDGTWSELVAITRRWQRCATDGSACVDIDGASADTYVPGGEDVGFGIRVVVTATGAGGATSVASDATAAVSAPAPPPPADPAPGDTPTNPVPATPPSITGTAVEGETLGVNDNVASDSLDVALQWQLCSATGDACAAIDAAVKPTYTLGAADVGSTIRIEVTALDAAGASTTTTSEATSVIAAAAPSAQQPPPAAAPLQATTPPAVSGAAVEGATLSADDGTWPDGTTLARRWQRCDAAGSCQDIPGETQPTYTVASEDIGATIRIAVDATAATETATATSDPTDVVAAAPAPAPATAPASLTLPAVGDPSPTARERVTALPGTWQSADTALAYTYQWQRCDTAGANCTAIGSGGPSYVPADADVGSTLRVVVTAADDSGLSTAATSRATARVAPFSKSGFWSWQLGPYAIGLDAQWDAVDAANARTPAIAIVDSGVDSSLPGISGGTVVEKVNLTSLPQRSTDDGYGHGSFVAQVAAGRARGAAGASPTAPIVSLDVMNDNGMAMTSDVIAAADWIYLHKSSRNIRVANFSLIGGSPSSVMFDPLDRALERLWLSGVVVVTAAGNFAVDGQASDEPYGPANDPFLITVGAADTNDTLTTADDYAAPWSAYGHTADGFAKPELGAPGRYVVASVPTDSTLYTTRTDRIVSPGKLELSGTSFAAPVVAGVAANLLALHPGWNPDQVKGALMLSATQPGAANPYSLGVGEIDARAALGVTDPPNPNAAIDQFVVPDPAGGPTKVFDTASWGTAAQADASWGTASWGTASWGTASWGTASWGTAYWSSASWGTASWGTASWGTASWGTASWGTASWGTDNAKDDVLPAGSYWMHWG
jgi:hypothetical protein